VADADTLKFDKYSLLGALLFTFHVGDATQATDQAPYTVQLLCCQEMAAIWSDIAFIISLRYDG